MIKSLIFDFDGVIANTEPVHYAAFRDVLREKGYNFSKDEYYSHYLAYDDKTLFIKYYESRDKLLSYDELHKILSRKSDLYNNLINHEISTFPGVAGFLEKIRRRYRIAIGSGALRQEILEALKILKFEDYFELIVSANEVEKCKPDPEVYNMVLERLNTDKDELILPGECLVIEDSIYGIKAAKSAGMKCVAITNTYPASELTSADVIVERIDLLNLDDLTGIN